MNSYYLHSINKAIDYIENNFDKKIKLEDVASISNFSKYHFHRIFKSIVNETLNDYIKRIRLEKAIRQLMSLPEKAIKDIAMDCGYDNPANFSRDFQNKYNKTPLQVREDKKIPPMGISTDKNLPPIELSEVKFIPSKKLVYKRISDGYNSHTIRPAFEELYYFAEENNISSQIENYVGIGYDDPDVTSPDKCRYDAGFIVPENTQISVPEKFNQKSICNELYAMFFFEGKVHEFKSAWDLVFKNWLIKSDYVPLNLPHMELYLYSEKHELGIYKAYLCIPVEPIKK